MAETIQSSKSRYFSFVDGPNSETPAPWRVAFPQSKPLGYYEVFGKRCSKISSDAVRVVDEETAKRVWLSILKDYEDFQRMGMWLPEEELEGHRKVASALGWY